jgi:hypothetical protein
MMAMQTYVVPGGNRVIPFKEFIPTLDCGNEISYTFLLNSGDPLPAFITGQIDPLKVLGGGSVSINVPTRRIVTETSFVVFIKGTSEEFNPPTGATIETVLVVPITIVIPNTGPPVFKSPLRNFVVQVGNVCPVKIPQISDPD